MQGNERKRGLGRGLSALMSDVNAAAGEVRADGVSQAPLVLPIELIQPNPEQPRKVFEQSDLDELATSIQAKGIIQPLIVRQTSDTSYQLVAGERRWRAAQIANLHEVPVVIRDYSDIEVLEIAIIENVQRADLNPVEEANGYRQLMDRFGHTQEKLAEALGKSRSHIANILRLLQLPQSVLDLLQNGKLTSGHARALITAENPEALAMKVVQGGLSVRATEALVKKQGQASAPAKSNVHRSDADQEKDADTRALEGDLSAILNMKVTLTHHDGNDGGTLSVQYKSLDQLDELCRVLSGG